MRRVVYYLEFIGDDVTLEFDKAFHTLRRELRSKDPWFNYSMYHPDIHRLYISIEELDEQERLVFILQNGHRIKPYNKVINKWMGPGEFQIDMNIPND